MASNCKLFSLDSQETLDEFENLLSDSNADLESDIKKLSDYITNHDQSAEIETRAPLIEGFLSTFYADNFEELDPKVLSETVSRVLDGETQTYTEQPNVVTGSNDVDLYPEPVVTSDLSTVFASISDQNVFKRIYRNGLINSLFIGSDLISRGSGDTQNISRRYRFNQSDSDFNVAIQNMKQEVLDRLISYYNSKSATPVQAFNMYTGGKFDSVSYNDFMLKLKPLFSETLAANRGKWYSKSDFDTKAYYDYTFLQNFDNFISTQFDGLIKIARGYFNTHETPAKANKYATNIQKHIHQDWNDTTNSMYDNMNQAVSMYINSMELLDSRMRKTGEYVTTNNFQNVLKAIRDMDTDIYDWYGLRHNPYMISEIFESIYNNVNGIKDRIFSKENRGLLNTFNTMYVNMFSKNPNSLLTIFNNMNGRVSQNDIYSMIVNHANKMSPVSYTQTVFNADTNSYETILLDSYNLSPKKKVWEDNIVVSAKNGLANNVLSKYNVEFRNKDGLLDSMSVTVGEGIKLNIAVTAVGNKKGIVYRNKGFEMQPKAIAELIKSNPDEFQDYFSDVLNKQLDDSYLGIMLDIATDEDLAGLLDLSVATLLTYDVAKELNEELGNGYDYKQAKAKISSRYGHLLSGKNDSAYMQAEMNTLRPGSLFRALTGLDLLAKVTSIVNGDFRRSYVVNMDKGKLPKYRLTSLMNDDKFLFNNNSTKSILRNNIFNPADGWDLGTYLKTDFSNKEGDHKSTFNMIPTELLYSQFVGDYLSQVKSGRASFQPLNYADKSNIWTKMISMNKEINGKKLSDSKLTPSEISDFHFETMHDIFGKFEGNLLADYKTFFESYNEMHEGETGFEPIKIKSDIKHYQKEIQKLTLDDVHATIIYIQEDNPDFMFISEVHYSPKGNKIRGNPTLNKWLDMYTTEDPSKFKAAMDYQKKLYAYTLLNNNVRFKMLEADGTVNELLDRKGAWVDNNLKQWINFKLTDKNGNALDESELTLDNIDNVNVELNPELDKFFELDNLVTNHYVAATFGFSFIHPSKYRGNTDTEAGLREDEASRVSAMFKRGVIAGGTIHTILKGNKEGAPDKYRIAVVQDSFFPVINIHAEDDMATVYDGSIWLDPMTAIWEAKSMEELKLSDVHRKPIGYINQSNYLSSALLKCATFSLNNELMRKSVTGEVNGENLFRSMSDGVWKDQEGNPLVIDITDNNPINFNNLYYIDENTLQKWQLLSLEKADGQDNTYVVTKRRVTDTGSPVVTDGESAYTTDTLHINNNYQLWKALGGKFSLELVRSNIGEPSLQYSEGSVQYAAQIANDVEAINARGKSYQPLKASNINYLANESAVKQGVFNINPTSTVFNNNAAEASNLANRLASASADTDFIGIQMNADHEVDDGAMSEPTQVLSALIQKGLDADLANEVYEDLGFAIRESLQDNKFLDAYDTEEAKTEIYRILGKNLIKTFDGDDDNLGLTAAYLQFVKEDILNSNKLLADQKYKIPFDDPNIFNKFYSGFASGINKDIIKRKYAGIGAVLNPSHDLITLYDIGGGTTSTYDEIIKGLKSREDLQNLMDTLKQPVQVGEVRHGDIIDIVDNSTIREDGSSPTVTYRVGGYTTNGEFMQPNGSMHGRFRLIGLSEVRALRGNDRYSVIRRGDLGRNLRGQNTDITINPNDIQGTTDSKFDLYDLDLSRLSYNLDYIFKNLAEDGISPATPEFANQNIYQVYREALDRLDSNPDLVDPNSKEEQHGSDMFVKAVNKYRALTGKKDGKSKEQAAIYFGKIKTYITNLLQEDLDMLSEQSLFRVPLRYRKSMQYVPATYNNVPNEMLLGRPWATKFGLRKGDNVYDILRQGETFFKARLVEKNFTDSLPSEEYDFHLFSFNGSDVYVKALENMDDIDSYIGQHTDEYSEKKVNTIINNGITYRVDEEGNTLYRYEPSVMKTIVNDMGREVILVVSDNINYLDSPEDFNFINISKNINSNENVPKVKKDLLQFITNSKVFDKRTKKLIENGRFNTVKYKEIVQDTAGHLAKKMAASFDQALNFIVARIPAQSMQSFMNMRIAGFIESNTNIVYIPIEQLVYQGSDYDIDKAYILGAGINRQGIYYNWSPYFSFESKEAFEASNSLPLPNGRMYTVSKTDNSIEKQLNEVRKQLDTYRNRIQTTYERDKVVASALTNKKAKERALKNAEKHRIALEEAPEYQKLMDESNRLDAEVKKGKTTDITELVNQLLSPDAIYGQQTFMFADTVDEDGKPLRVSSVRNIERLSDFLRTVTNMDSKLETTLSDDINQFIAEIINKHTTYRMTPRDKSEAVKNKVYFNMWKIGQNVTNTIAQTSPITMGPARNKANNSSSGQYSKYLSNNNPGTRVIQQYQNSIGKDSIGITATGIKILSALLTYYHIKWNQSTPEDMHRLRLTNGVNNTSETGSWEFSVKDGDKVTKLDLKFSPTLSNINWKKIKSEAWIDEIRKEQILYDNVPEDVFLTISVLLSASTDNAKELILEKINASPDLAGTYIYMLIGGVDFDRAATFMTTPEVSAVAQKSKSNILYKGEKNNNVDNAVKYLTNGVNIEEYMDNPGAILNLLANKYGKLKDIPWGSDTFVDVIENIGNEWISRNNKDSDPENRIKSQVLVINENTTEDEIAQFEEMEGDVVRDKDIIQFNNYVAEVKNRLRIVKGLNLDNVQLLGILHNKAQELTRLGRLLAINQGIKTKIVDKLNYLSGINNFVTRKLGWSNSPFDLIKFLRDPAYNKMAVDAYELTKDTFNILDIINTTPHFRAMLTALWASENVPNALTLRSKFVPMLVNRVKPLIQGSLLPKHVSIVNGFTTDILINKFLNDIKVPITNIESRYVGNDLLSAVESEQTLDLDSVEDRMTFKHWFETTLLSELKSEYPDNTFIQDLGFGYYRNRVSNNVYTLLKLPINLNNIEKEGNEIRYGNYLKDFNKLKFERIGSNPGLDIGNMFFLYNLIVNKNQPGEYSITKIFQDYLNTTNEFEREKLDDTYATQLMNFMSSFAFNGNTLKEGKDYDMRDLVVRMLGKGVVYRYKDAKGMEHTLTKSFDTVAKKFKVTEQIGNANPRVLEFKGEDNTTDLPFLKDDYNVYNDTQLHDIFSKLLDMYSNNTVEIKLTCD